MIPPGAGFEDMVSLEGEPDIGDQTNKEIIASLAFANKPSDLPNLNEAAKLGTGKEMVKRMTNFVASRIPGSSSGRAALNVGAILHEAYEYSKLEPLGNERA